MSHVAHINESCRTYKWVMWQQVLALECLITAYSMSALYLDGVSKGENQMMATGILLMFASIAFSCAYKRAVYLYKRAVYLYKRAVYLYKRAVYLYKRALIKWLPQAFAHGCLYCLLLYLLYLFAKVPDVFANEPYIFTKEPSIKWWPQACSPWVPLTPFPVPTNELYFLAKVPNVFAKEP